MNIQFKKGVLELCVLSLLSKKDCYGYELVTKMSMGIGLSEGTVYPLLKRLREENYFTTYIEESSEGPARKYYRILPEGIEYKNELMGEWYDLVKHVNIIIEGDEGYAQ